MSLIIGICGFIGSGKGTVGNMISDGYGFEKDSFARPLKDAAATIFGWDRNMVEGETPESRKWREQPDEFWTGVFGRPFTPREALQKLGTEAGRNVFHPDIWTGSLLKRAQNKNIIVTDVRFKNEVDAIRKANGKLIWVMRGPLPVWYDLARLANQGDVNCIRAMEERKIHLSEWDWIGTEFDELINNDGSLADLKTKTDTVMNRYHDLY